MKSFTMLAGSSDL